MRRIYFDHAATTPLDREVLEAMMPYFSDKYGNASSLHLFGREAREAVENSREKIAKIIGASSEEIYFTSGGTESNNLAIKGVAFSNKEKKHIITSKIEHHAVLHPCEYLEKNGWKVSYASVNSEGIVCIDEIEKLVSKKTLLISVMHANNEIGTIQPIAEIGEIAKKKDVLLHSDAVQTVGKIPVNVEKLNVDLLSISGHKFYGPKGVGALYIRKGTKIEAIAHGGGHEHGLRSGTENVPGIVGLAKALELAYERMRNGEAERIERMRDKLIREVLNNIEEVRLNGHEKIRLPNNANFSFYGVEGEALVLKLDAYGIAASTGSACSSHSLEPSHVLIAIGLKPEDAHGSLRITLGKDNTEQEINYFLEILPKIVNELREISVLR
ncbi:MAG: cysteine desulfurase NifS [Candidatus Altiarchaeota archaeon]